MTLRSMLRCLRHLRTWRQCLYEEVKADPTVGEWRNQRHAAIDATRSILREARREDYETEPVTAMLGGTYRPQRRRRPPPRSRPKGTP
jgi:hypothetical protein